MRQITKDMFYGRADEILKYHQDNLRDTIAHSLYLANAKGYAECLSDIEHANLAARETEVLKNEI